MDNNISRDDLVLGKYRSDLSTKINNIGQFDIGRDKVLHVLGMPCLFVTNFPKSDTCKTK